MRTSISPRRLSPALVILLFSAAACSNKPAAKTGASTASGTQPPTTVVRNERQAPAPPPEAAPQKETLPDVAELNRRGTLQDTFFDFDRYEVRTDQRDRLTTDATWLRKWPNVKVRIEGHCDERGTAQYNMALGEKRAEAAKEYLQTLGIDASRIEILSYGKEKPFVDGHDETAWSQNRRDHFLVIAR